MRSFLGHVPRKTTEKGYKFPPLVARRPL